jgi:hypothetical protein
MQLCTLPTREEVGAKRGESLIVLQVIAPFSRDICTVFWRSLPFILLYF